MAKGQFQNSIGSYGLDVVWETTPNTAENTSTLSVSVFVRYYSISIGSRLCRCTVNGQTQEVTVSPLHHSGSAARTQVASFQFTLPHKPDGTALFSLEAGFRFDLTSGNYGYIDWLTATGQVTPEPIPRAAVLTATDGHIGGSVLFSFTPGAPEHSFSFLLDTGKIVEERQFPGGTTGTITFSLPLPAADYLEALMGTPPAATFTARLTTLQNGEAIGTAEAAFTVTLPPYEVPVVSVTACHRATVPGVPDPGGKGLYLDVRVTDSPYPRDMAVENDLRLYLDAGTGKQALPLTAGVFSGLVEDLTLDTDRVYRLTLWAEDASDCSATVYRDIPTAAADFHLRQGGQGAAFGCYATREKVLQLAEGWTLYLGDRSLEDYIRSILQTPSP